MNIQQLKELIDAGEFDHATYRDLGTLWEGLWIYRKDTNGFRGYSPAGSFFKDSPELDQASKLCAGTGISLGAYGEG